MTVFDLTEIQANYILDMPLRRLTKFSKIELDKEADELRRTIEELDEILGDDARLRKVVADELAEVAKTYGTPRRTVLLESSGQTTTASATPLEVADDPCYVFLSSSGLLARTTTLDPPGDGGSRTRHDVIVSAVATTARGEVGVVTSAGRVVKLGVLDLPTLPSTANHPNLQGGAPVGEFLTLEGERVLGLTGFEPRLPRPGARHPSGRGQAGQPGVPLGPRRLGRHLAQGRRRGRRRGRAAHRRGDALLRHQRRPAAALRRRQRAPAGSLRRRHRRHQAGRRGPGGLVHRARPGRRPCSCRCPAPPRRCPAPRPGR